MISIYFLIFLLFFFPQKAFATPTFTQNTLNAALFAVNEQYDGGCMIGTSHAIFTYRASSDSKPRFDICSISGTSMSASITAGLLYDTTSWDQGTIAPIYLGNNYILIVYSRGSGTKYGRCYYWNGSTLTEQSGGEYNLYNGSAGIIYSSAGCMLNSSTILIYGGSYSDYTTRVTTVAYSAPTGFTASNTTTEISSSDQCAYSTRMNVALLDNDDIIFSYTGRSGYQDYSYSRIYNWNGSSFSSVSNIGSSGNWNGRYMTNVAFTGYFVQSEQSGGYGKYKMWSWNGSSPSEAIAWTNIVDNMNYTIALKSGSNVFFVYNNGSSHDIRYTSYVYSNAPGAPGNPTFTNVANKSLTVSWTAGTGATSHTIQRNGVSIATNATSPYNDTGLVPHTSYTYRIIAVNSDGSTNCTTDQTQLTTWFQKKILGSTPDTIISSYPDKVIGI